MNLGEQSRERKNLESSVEGLAMACRLISLEAALTSGSWTMPIYRRTESLGGSRSEMELKSSRSRGTGRLLECVRTALDVSRISYD